MQQSSEESTMVSGSFTCDNDDALLQVLSKNPTTKSTSSSYQPRTRSDLRTAAATETTTTLFGTSSASELCAQVESLVLAQSDLVDEVRIKCDVESTSDNISRTAWKTQLSTEKLPLHPESPSALMVLPPTISCNAEEFRMPAFSSDYSTGTATTAVSTASSTASSVSGDDWMLRGSGALLERRERAMTEGSLSLLHNGELTNRSGAAGGASVTATTSYSPRKNKHKRNTFSLGGSGGSGEEFQILAASHHMPPLRKSRNGAMTNNDFDHILSQVVGS